MKKIIALIFPFLFSCAQERIDLPNSVVQGAWSSYIWSFVFYSNTCECRFESLMSVKFGKYYIAEKTVIMSMSDGSVMRLTIKHYDSKQIICNIDYLGESNQMILIKI